MTEPTVSVCVEIKKSDGNYGTRTGCVWVNNVPAGATQEQISGLIETAEVCFDYIRDNLKSKFRETAKEQIQGAFDEALKEYGQKPRL